RSYLKFCPWPQGGVPSYASTAWPADAGGCALGGDSAWRTIGGSSPVEEVGVLLARRLSEMVDASGAVQVGTCSWRSETLGRPAAAAEGCCSKLQHRLLVPSS